MSIVGGISTTTGRYREFATDENGYLYVVIGGSGGGGGGGTIDTELPPAALLADATAESAVPSVGSRLLGFNGTTWDRVRSGLTGALSSVVGVQNQLPIGQFLTSPPTLTNGQFLPLQMSSAGRLLVETGSTATTPLADDELNPSTSRQGSNLLLYNNNTWDRGRCGVKTADDGIGFLNSINSGVFKTLLPTLTDNQTHPAILSATGALYTGHRPQRQISVNQFQALYNQLVFNAAPIQVNAYDVTVVFVVATTAGSNGAVRLTIEVNNELGGFGYWAIVYNKVVTSSSTNSIAFIKGYVGQVRFAVFQLTSGQTMTVDTTLTFGE